MKYLVHTLLSLLVLILALGSCQESDDVGPIMTLVGDDTLYIELNSTYTDPGATATDETDGNVTANIFVDNPVNTDLMGEYTVTYKCVDKAGNEAVPMTRVVYVLNAALIYYGEYQAEESEVPPGQLNCNYPVFVWADTLVNNRLVFDDFACGFQREVFADVLDTIIVMPFQQINDSAVQETLQGYGWINDSVISFEYSREDSLGKTFWNILLNRK